MKYLITGGCGFLGTHIATALLEKKQPLVILDNLSRYGSTFNLEWLKTKGTFEFSPIDIRNRADVEHMIRQHQPDVIFHLAGQVAMTTSLQNPLHDFETNVQGGMYVLESVRCFCPETIIIYSSTNKVYGDLINLSYKETATRYITADYPEGLAESLPLNFASPYGCSKGAMDQYMLDYARMFNLKTVVFRHSSIYGGRQYSTYDQGWVGWFIKEALRIKKGEATSLTLSGNGKQVRDLLYASDLVNCYLGAIPHIDRVKGHAFNIGGGVENSLSLLELLQLLEEKLEVKLHYQTLPFRASDQKVFIANSKKARDYFNWQPKVNYLDGIQNTLHWIKNTC
ncbi:MAG: hypothetical protein ACD_60C00119G0006 [uncultured bacterium]|nr:MAG: hypothetical protein ACD_60C00119G0006 [uncultured bacterium]